MHVCPEDTLYTKRHRFWWKRWWNRPQWPDLSLLCQSSRPTPVRWSPGGPDSPKPSLARRTPSQWTAVKQVQLSEQDMFVHITHNALIQMTKQLLFCFVRDKHVNGRSARAKDSLWGSVRQTHGQQNVQCHIHSEGERRLHPDSQMGRRNGARKPFPRHRALKTVFRPSPLCKDSTDRPGKETGLTDNAFSSHINQENVFYICIRVIQSPLCAHFTLGYVPSFFCILLF